MVNATLQYRRHSFLWRPNSRLTSNQLVMDEFRKFPSFEWLNDDIVRFQKDSGHRTLHVWVATDQQRKRIRLGVAHRGDHCETIARIRHVQVGNEHIEALGNDESQRFCHSGDSNYLKSFAFECRIHHCENCMIVIHQQDSMYIRLVGRRNTWKGNNGAFGWSHTAPPLITNNVNILLSVHRKMYKTEHLRRWLLAIMARLESGMCNGNSQRCCLSLTSHCNCNVRSWPFSGMPTLPSACPICRRVAL